MYVIYDLIFMGQLKSRGYHGIKQHYIPDKWLVAFSITKNLSFLPQFPIHHSHFLQYTHLPFLVWWVAFSITQILSFPPHFLIHHSIFLQYTHLLFFSSTGCLWHPKKSFTSFSFFSTSIHFPPSFLTHFLSWYNLSSYLFHLFLLLLLAPLLLHLLPTPSNPIHLPSNSSASTPRHTHATTLCPLSD